MITYKCIIVIISLPTSESSRRFADISERFHVVSLLNVSDKAINPQLVVNSDKTRPIGKRIIFQTKEH